MGMVYSSILSILFWLSKVQKGIHTIVNSTLFDILCLFSIGPFSLLRLTNCMGGPLSFGLSLADFFEGQGWEMNGLFWVFTKILFLFWRIMDKESFLLLVKLLLSFFEKLCHFIESLLYLSLVLEFIFEFQFLSIEVVKSYTRIYDFKKSHVILVLRFFPKTNKWYKKCI